MEGTRTGGLRERLALWLEGERERWLLWVPVALGAGIALYFALPREPGLVSALAPAAAIAIIASWARGATLPTVALGLLLAMLAGLALVKVRAGYVAAPILERRLANTEVRGFVERVELRATRGERFTLRVRTLGTLPEDKRPLRIRVRTLSGPSGLKPGDAVRVKATLGAPGAPVVPGGYDFARQAWFQQIGAVGYALARPEPDTEAQEAPLDLRIRAHIERVRHAIGERISAAVPGETGAIARALITGERGGISEATNDAYRDSGLFHILSISGLHMVIMGGAIYFAVRLLLACVPVLALDYPIKKWAAVAAASGSLGYLLISGAEFATVRSYIMINFMFLAILLDRPGLALRNVALSALVILFAWPESIHDVGFQMSFAAVTALVAAHEAVRERVERRDAPPGALLKVLLFFGGIVLSTLVASLAVAPFGAYHFHKSQQFAILANLIAIPICNLAVMPAALVTLVAMPLGLEALPLKAMAAGIDAISESARWVAAMPGAVARVKAIPSLSFALMLSGGLWLCLVRQRARLAGLGIVVLGLGVAPFEPRPDVLIGRNGRLVAARAEDGRLSAISGRGGDFELSRWLEHDGDGRKPREAMAQGGAMMCDGAGCAGRVKGLLLAAARHPAAIADDCARADIAVLPVPRPADCRRPRLVVDLYAVLDKGTHALFIGEGGAIEVRTVAETRGERPWVAARGRKPRPLDASTVSAGQDRRRIGGFAAPRLVGEPIPGIAIEPDADEDPGLREAEPEDP